MALVTVVDPNGDQNHFASGHPERPERTAAIRAAVAVLDGVEVVGCRPAPLELIGTVHSPEQINSVRELSEAGGGWFDADTYCTTESFGIALLSAGTAVRATEITVREQRHTFALTRPPGHHATRERVMGFCLFNNVVIAAKYAQNTLGLDRVAIVDIDVHHGNGTEDLAEDDQSLLYCSLHQWPLYPGTGAPDSSHDNVVNVALPPGTGDDAWLMAFEDKVLTALDTFAPDLIMVSAGFDALGTDPLAGLNLTPGLYAEAAKRLLTKTPRATVWCLEGGYDTQAMPRAVVGILETLRDS